MNEPVLEVAAGRLRTYNLVVTLIQTTKLLSSFNRHQWT